MAKRRKKRTSIKTAAGTAQDAFLARMTALRDDPTRVLPTCTGPEPKVLAKLRSNVEAIAAGKSGFLLKRDKGIAGAILQSMPLADLPSVPRLADHKIGGRRRFYLMRGQVTRGAMIGVQNHDDAQALLFAYRDLAKSNGLHFFADPGLVCTGAIAQPSAQWVAKQAEKGDFPLDAIDEGWSCPHPELGQVCLQFGATQIRVCGRCGAKKGGLHARLASHYAGTSARQPFEVSVLTPTGTIAVPEREQAAGYRAGILDEDALIRACASNS